MNAYPYSQNNWRIEKGNREQCLQTSQRLLTEVQALSSRIAAVNEIASAINHSISLDEILRIVGKKAKWLLDFEHCSVYLQNRDRSYRLIPLFGSPIESDCDLSSQDNPIRRAIKTGQPQLNPDDCHDTFFRDYSSQMVLPLESKQQVIGTINFAKTALPDYTLDDLRIAYLLAVQVSAAVQNAQHFEEINRLFEEMHRLYSQLHAEQHKSDELLLNILPQKIADELKQTGKVKPVRYESTSVLFTDFKDFTKLGEQLTPEELVDELDYCFSHFDKVVETHNLEKLKTIGDSYMAVAGVPTPTATHAIDAVLAALHIRQFMHWRKLEKMQSGQPYWEIRIGIHSGSLLAGVIGKQKFTYDVWGDTVNTAARMESASRSGQINISQATFERVREFFDCRDRGKIAVKNKSKINMYFVNGIKENLTLYPDGILPNNEFNARYLERGHGGN